MIELVARPTTRFREWTARSRGQVVAGARAWTFGARATLQIEAAPRALWAAPAVLEAVCAELDCALELTTVQGDPLLSDDALTGCGFERTALLVGVHRSLVGYRSPWSTRLCSRPVGDAVDEIVPLLERVLLGRPDSAVELWARMTLEAGALLDLDRWRIVAADGVDVGVAFPQPGVGGAEGSLALVGLVPEARGRGLGAPLHAIGLEGLARARVSAYVDSTEADNTAMRRVFARNGCVEGERQVVWVRPGRQRLP